MKINKYNYLLQRVNYPFGYRMESVKLPDWIHITITLDGDSKHLTVHSRIHVNKEVKMPTTYSTDFSDYDIIRDQSGKISSRFL